MRKHKNPLTTQVLADSKQRDEESEESVDKKCRGFINLEHFQAAFNDMDAMNHSGGSGGDGHVAAGTASDFNNEADDEEEGFNRVV